MSDTLTAEDVAAIRLAKGWSTYQMAKFLGCNQSTVWRMEHGGNISGPAQKLLQGLRAESSREAFAA
jgi:transcriptional regulator with XRE-family HTH domain